MPAAHMPPPTMTYRYNVHTSKYWATTSTTTGSHELPLGLWNWKAMRRPRVKVQSCGLGGANFFGRMGYGNLKGRSCRGGHNGDCPLYAGTVDKWWKAQGSAANIHSKGTT